MPGGHTFARQSLVLLLLLTSCTSDVTTSADAPLTVPVILMGDVTTSPGSPSYLVSVDGIDWDLRYIALEAGAAIRSLHATPESPPWPGQAAIADASGSGLQLVAVGWSTVPDGSLPMVWRTTDSENWTASVLENRASPNEWASRVTAGTAGYLVTTNGPFHETNQLWFSYDGIEWEYIGRDQFTIGSILAVNNGGPGRFVVATTDNFGAPPHRLWNYTGAGWEQLPLPPQLSHAGRLSLHLVHDRVTVVVGGKEGSEVWSFSDEEGWVRHLATTVDLFVDNATPAGLRVVGLERTIVRSWTLLETQAVVLVAENDVLNVREAIMGNVLGTLSPTATGIVVTGEGDGAMRSVWVPIRLGEAAGWVKSDFLTSEVSDRAFAVDPEPFSVLEDFAKILRTRDRILGVIGTKV